MKCKTTTHLFAMVFLSMQLFAQKPGSNYNLLMIQGDDFKQGATSDLSCGINCLTVDKDAGFIAFNLVGKMGEKNVSVSVETPVLKGTKKIKVDKDSDARIHQKVTIEVFGSNPAVDKDTYEIQDVTDEGIVNIMRYNESTGELEGTFSSKYFDGSTGIKKLSATCHFLIRKN